MIFYEIIVNIYITDRNPNTPYLIFNTVEGELGVASFLVTPKVPLMVIAERNQFLPIVQYTSRSGSQVHGPMTLHYSKIRKSASGPNSMILYWPTFKDTPAIFYALPEDWMTSADISAGSTDFVVLATIDMVSFATPSFHG